jgi:hypothetical protein
MGKSIRGGDTQPRRGCVVGIADAAVFRFAKATFGYAESSY